VAADVRDTWNIFTLSATAAALLVASKCLTIDEAFAAVNGRVLLGIVATYGLGAALERTKVAALLASSLVAVGGTTGPQGLLAVLFFTVALLSGVVSNQATVILLWPVVRGIDIEGVSIGQFAIVLMMGASCAFMTPVRKLYHYIMRRL